MQLQQCQNVILLHRLRMRARRLMDVNLRAGNRTVAEIYAKIDKWLETQMARAISASQ
ncbi:hypothetical protein [Asticcacaulis sp. AND118]|uniref:hypothetical protein n=1 Tax=Asticcacaulis sp. AND118 TaxID=2840468 RepID=UPI001CFFF9E2|nr:hypothetical protein [Asticcacaulis sp. AND118]UDF03052.1 hypothetical protein LH365_11510 [Asticcacaulis sp. AND118]